MHTIDGELRLEVQCFHSLERCECVWDVSFAHGKRINCQLKFYNQVMDHFHKLAKNVHRSWSKSRRNQFKCDDFVLWIISYHFRIDVALKNTQAKSTEQNAIKKCLIDRERTKNNPISTDKKKPSYDICIIGTAITVCLYRQSLSIICAKQVATCAKHTPHATSIRVCVCRIGTSTNKNNLT